MWNGFGSGFLLKLEKKMLIQDIYLMVVFVYLSFYLH